MHRFKPKTILKIFTENKNYEILKLFQILETLKIKNNYKIYNLQMVYLSCPIFEFKLQIFDILGGGDILKSYKKINLNNVYTEQGIATLIKEAYFKKNMLVFNYKKDLYLAKAFIGGRVETYQKVTSNQTRLDFNFFYLNLMKTNLPYGSATLINNPINFKRPGFYNVKIDQTYLNWALLPSVNNHKISYPKSIFEGTFWFEELEKFIEYGGIILNIYDGLVFSQYDEFLKNFILDFEKKYDKRTTKKIIIQLFGSLCVRDWVKPQFLIKDEHIFLEMARRGDVGNFIKSQGIFIVESSATQYKKICKTNCAAAAAITAKGRIKLYELGLKIGLKNIASLRIDEITLNTSINRNQLEMIQKEFNLKVL